MYQLWYNDRMTTTANTTGNRNKVAQVEAALAALLAETLRRGFFGTIRLELAVQDGTIQNVRKVVEQVER
jgi:hypothetical protein